MLDADIKEDYDALHINVHSITQLRSNIWDRDPEKDRPLTLPYIVSVERGPEVAKVRSHRPMWPPSSNGDLHSPKRHLQWKPR
jgi:hypothetical protein